MIRFLDILALLLQYAYVSVFFVILLNFLPLRLLFWIGAWWFLRKYLRQVRSNLTTKM